MRTLQNRITSLATLISFTGCLLLTPAGEALADDQCSSESSNCSTVVVAGHQVTFPELTLTPVATATANPSGGFSYSLAQGQQKQVDLNAAASALNISSSQVAQMVSSLPDSTALVYARLSTLTSEMDVTIFKIMRHGNTSTVYSGKFVPQMGNKWVASRTFLTSAEKAAGQLSDNPFRPFEGGDQEFHSIPTNNPAVAETIVGMATRFARAQMAVLSVAHFNERQWTTTAHHFFTTTTTVHTAGDENPVWLVGLPPGMNIDGDTSANYCLDSLVGSSCAVPEHQVVSGLAWSDWSTGNLPVSVATIHEFQVSHTGFNFISLLLVVATVAFGFTGIIAVLMHNNQTAGENQKNSAAYMNALLNTNLDVLGVQTGSLGGNYGTSAANVNYVSAGNAVGSGPFSAQNLTTSTTPTAPSSAFNPRNSDEVYFQSIEGQAMITAPAGQGSTQVDTSGNKGFQAFSTFDQGYNTGTAPSPATNLQFNTMQYIKDTQ
jgi:hypothetical protein